MNKVRTCKVSDVSLGVYDGPHATPPPCDSGAIFLGIRNITEDGQLKLDNPRYISEEDLPKWTKRVTPHGGDIVFTYEATLNLYAIIPEGFRGCLGRRMGLIRPNPEEINGRFLYYYFFSPQWRKLIAQKTVVGSTVNRIPIETFPDFKLLLPSKPTQSRIAAVLSALDEKIAHTNELIKMLEEQAQMVYDYWFMQFDFPDENGKPYRSSGGKMVWNEGLKREIPEGWKIAGIDRFLTLTRGVSYKPTDASDIPTPMHTCILRANNIDFGTIRWDGLVYVKTECVNQKTQRLKENDIVIVMSSGSKEHVGKTATAWGDLDCSYGAFCAKITPHEQCTSYVRTSLRSSTFRAFLKQQLLATNINNISLSVLANYIVPEPTYNVLERFQQITGEIYTRCNTLHAEIYELTKQRDFLLPLLMNGQVKVAE